MTQSTQIIDQISQAIGPERLLTGAEVHSRSAGIWRSDTIAADAIVRPKTVAEVSEILRLCNQTGQRVVPHGGLTGLVQSAITQPGDIAL